MFSKITRSFIFPEVRIVEASAGSGKTYALAKRYVQLLLYTVSKRLHANAPAALIPTRPILALTFTNKAAFEMKSRILEFLKTIALGQLTEDQQNGLLKPIGLTARGAQRSAGIIMESIIHHYNFFQVQTIDKFMNALLSGCAFKIGLTANFKIKTNAAEYLEYSLDQLIDSSMDDPNILEMFHRFLDNYLYLENRTGWFPKKDMLDVISALFAQNNSYGRAFRISSCSAQEIIQQKSVILNDIKRLKEILPVNTDARFLKALDKFLGRNTKSFDIDSVSDYFLRPNPPLKKGGAVSDELDQLWINIQCQLRQVCEQESGSLFNPYIDIFHQAMIKFYDFSKKEDVLFLGELNKKAAALFDEEYITVEELYYRLATRFHHYLIDEFQDTSRLQWKNLERMAEEALSTGGSLFYVGDRKQAIYGFRGGEVGLFDRVQQDFKVFNIQSECLDQNWRSHKAIVEFNNHVFSINRLKNFIGQKEQYESDKKKRHLVIFGQDDYQDIERVFAASGQSHQVKNDQGYVNIEYVDIDQKQERDEVIKEKVIGRVQELKQRFSYRDIAILTRSNAHIEQVTNWLLEAGVPVESERTSNVADNTFIRELIALLRFLNSPVDNLAFTEFILGDLFSKASGLTTEELHNFMFGLRARLNREKNLYVYMEFRQAYPEVWRELINGFFKSVGLYPLYELLVSVYHKLDCLNNFPAYQGFFMHFLELVKKYEDEHSDLSSFLDYFENLIGEDLYVNVTDSEAVKVLTIHKSKGLEFPVVIIPFLGIDIQVGSQSANQKQFYVLQEHDSLLELLRLKSKYYGFSDRLYQVYRSEYKKAFLSELNSVYVALTRPQCELYGFIPKKIKNTFNLARFLIPQDRVEVGARVCYSLSGTGTQFFEKFPVSQYHDWIHYLKDEFKASDTLKQRQQKKRGEILHYMLSLIGRVNDQNKEEILGRVLEEAKQQFPHNLIIDECFLNIQGLLEQGHLKCFFYVDDDADVLTEKEVINSYGQTKRVDRLIVTQNEVWVIDYKSSRDYDGVYQQQIEDYMRVIQEIYPKHAVKGYLIFLDTLAGQEVT